MDHNPPNEVPVDQRAGGDPPSYTPPGTPPRVPRPGNSSSGSDIGRLADVLERLIPRGERVSERRPQPFLNTDIIPEFDPIKKTITAGRWLEKVNQYGEMGNWSDLEKLIGATRKLRTDARAWYDGLNQILSWNAFSEQLQQTFPDNFRFGRALWEAANYSHNDGQTLESYCIKKLSLLNRLHKNFTEAEQVDFVAHGLRNEQLVKMTLAAQCQDIAALKAVFSSYDNAGDKRETRTERNEDRTRGRKRNYPQAEGQNGRQGEKFPSVKCYSCDQYGHIQRNCPKMAGPSTATAERKEANSQSIKCYSCDQYGHYQRNCPKGQQQQANKGKPYCSTCKSGSHSDSQCRKQNRDKPPGNQ